MSQAPEVELKDLLLSNSSFGPSEIEFISGRISNDFSQFPALKEVTQQLESQMDRTPRRTCDLAFANSCSVDMTTRSRPLATPTVAPWRIFTRPRALCVEPFRQSNRMLRIGQDRRIRIRTLHARDCRMQTPSN